jgi:hypothetical protein
MLISGASEEERRPAGTMIYTGSTSQSLMPPCNSAPVRNIPRMRYRSCHAGVSGLSLDGVQREGKGRRIDRVKNKLTSGPSPSSEKAHSSVVLSVNPKRYAFALTACADNMPRPDPVREEWGASSTTDCRNRRTPSCPSAQRLVWSTQVDSIASR